MAVYFSIILPVYNVAPYLKRCIHSVLDQSFQDYEMILVDDGSTDESPEICDAYAEAYEQIRVIHKRNGGLSSARNTGLEEAQGTYVWWVDSDDWIDPEALNILHRVSCDKLPDVVKFNYYRVEGGQKKVSSNASPGLYEDANRDLLMNKAFYTAGKYGLSVWSHIYRRSFLKVHSMPFISERIVGSEDYLFNLSLYPYAEKMIVIPDALYFYEMRQGSLTQQYKQNMPHKYGQLYGQLKQVYQKLNLLEKYENRICFFYVWHLLRGTCIPNEYYVSETHSLADGRGNIRIFLKAPEVRQAIRIMDRKPLSFRDKLFCVAMYWRMEPLFYWLYVVKPSRRKGE